MNSIGCNCNEDRGEHTYDREYCPRCGHYRDCIDHVDTCEWMLD